MFKNDPYRSLIPLLNNTGGFSCNWCNSRAHSWLVSRVASLLDVRQMRYDISCLTFWRLVYCSEHSWRAMHLFQNLETSVSSQWLPLLFNNCWIQLDLPTQFLGFDIGCFLPLLFLWRAHLSHCRLWSERTIGVLKLIFSLVCAFKLRI